jgi:hypothetical protein
MRRDYSELRKKWTVMRRSMTVADRTSRNEAYLRVLS